MGRRFPVFWVFQCSGCFEMKLDYRDGLVDFEYDPKRVQPFAR